jgi:hypothetical protein
LSPGLQPGATPSQLPTRDCVCPASQSQVSCRLTARSHVPTRCRQVDQFAGQTKTPEVARTSGVQTCQNQHLPTSTAPIKHRPTASIGVDSTECRRSRIDKRARGRTGQGGQELHGSCGAIWITGVPMTSTGIETQKVAGRFTEKKSNVVAPGSKRKCGCPRTPLRSRLRSQAGWGCGWKWHVDSNVRFQAEA